MKNIAIKNIAIIGSTGSIGRQTLAVIEASPERFRVVALAAGGNLEELVGQITRHRPQMVSVADEVRAAELRDRLGSRVQELGAEQGFAISERIRNDWLEANPASLIDKPGREVSRERVLTDVEIRRLWRLLSRQPTTAERGAPGRKRSTGEADDPICPVAPTLADAIKVRLLTAQRGG